MPAKVGIHDLSSCCKEKPSMPACAGVTGRGDRAP
jgi:hypothetical protein